MACKVQERDAIVLPCKHNMFCYECAQKLEL